MALNILVETEEREAERVPLPVVVVVVEMPVAFSVLVRSVALALQVKFHLGRTNNGRISHCHNVSRYNADGRFFWRWGIAGSALRKVFDSR